MLNKTHNLILLLFLYNFVPKAVFIKFWKFYNLRSYFNENNWFFET